MNSVVLLKFVSTSEGNILNPADESALETALSLTTPADIVCLLAMGPYIFKNLLLEYQARSPQIRSFLVSDVSLAGSDTAATSKALVAAFKTLEARLNVTFDLIIAGRRSVDGETSQVPVEFASRLGLPFLGNLDGKQISEENSCEKDSSENSKQTNLEGKIKCLTVLKQEEDNVARYVIQLPAVISIAEYSRSLRPVSLKGIRSLDEHRVCVLNLSDIGISNERSNWGVENSRTIVLRSQKIHIERGNTEFLTDPYKARETIEEAIHRALKARRHISDVPDKIDYKRLQEKDGRASILVLGNKDDLETVQLLKKASELASVCDASVVLIDVSKEISDCVNAAERIASCLSKLNPLAILAPSYSPYKDLSGSIAAILDCGLTADCIDLTINGKGILTQIRPAAADSLIAYICSKKSCIQMATVKNTYCDINTNRPIFLMNIETKSENDRIKRIETSLGKKRKEYNITEAEVIISGGAGLKNSENFQKLKDFANKHGAIIAGTRKAVDKGFVPYSRQVGLTGKTVSPELYIAVGISGAIQHIVGFRNAKKVIAINCDPHAAIFRYADQAIILDWEAVFVESS